MIDEVKASAKFDRILVSEGGDSIRYLIVDISAPGNIFKSRAESSPLNLALVIDCSRSMTGSRLKSAIEAAEGIIDALGEDDYVSIVSFSHDAIVHLDGIRCSATGKSSALSALKSISVRAGTNIAKGWFKGAECIGTVMLQRVNFKNHILILSDGHANQGSLEPAALSHHATELQARGVTASAVGIGDGYSTAQLYSIAQYGGGRIHHAAHPPEIAEVVFGELLELRTRTLENLKVMIDFPDKVSYKSLNIIPVEHDDVGACCFFGGLSAEASRSAVFRIAVHEGKKNEELRFDISCRWRNSGQARPSQGKTICATLKYVDATKNSLQAVDDETALRIARLWQSWIVWQATNLNRMKDYGKLDRFLLNEAKYFKRFCKVIPAASLLLNELFELSRIAHQDWDEASRKEIQTSTYTTLYGLKDTRSGTRKKWQDYTGEFTIM